MRIAVFFLLSGFLISGFLAGCNSNETLVAKLPKPPAPAAAGTPHPAQNPADNARRITAQELHAAWAQGKVLVVDTRTEPVFKQEHIKGAILIPAGDFASRAGELPLDKMIVTYCT
jgi:3-mercaptopyruvate sulfurtransferase SseA